MLHISAANLTDRAGSLAMFARYRQDLPNVSNVLTYSADTGKPFVGLVCNRLRHFAGN